MVVGGEGLVVPEGCKCMGMDECGPLLLHRGPPLPHPAFALDLASCASRCSGLAWPHVWQTWAQVCWGACVCVYVCMCVCVRVCVWPTLRHCPAHCLLCTRISLGMNWVACVCVCVRLCAGTAPACPCVCAGMAMTCTVPVPALVCTGTALTWMIYEPVRRLLSAEAPEPGQ